MKPNVSIIICTRDRAEDLRKTLFSLEALYVPQEYRAELLIVDNASSDHTAEVVRQAHLPNLLTRSVYETKQGLSHARNRAIAETAGDILLWTDDDIIPPPNWIEGMCGPILSGKANAIAGGIRIAPHLMRPWMQEGHKQLFASTEEPAANNPVSMIGANMAFSRSVLSRVPAFDIELGAGALGFHEEFLFSQQIKKAGYKLGSAFDVQVEHHFDPARLTRESMITSAQKGGRSEGYLAHHWEHKTLDVSLKRLYQQWRYLRFYQRQAVSFSANKEGMELQEFYAIVGFAKSVQYLRERRKSPHYEPNGLVKRAPP